MVEIAQKARESNAKTIAKHGKLTANLSEYHDGRTVPAVDATVQCAWLGDKFLSDVVIKTPIAGMARPKDEYAAIEWDKLQRDGKELPTQNFRVLYDGRRYLVYWPKALGSSGHLTIVATLDQVQDMLYGQYADQRPHTQWLNRPVGYPWTLWTQVDDRRNNRVKRWHIALNENTVTLTRFVQWQQGGRMQGGSQILNMNLDRHGAIVAHAASALDGGKIGPERQRVKATFNWEKQGDVSVMRSYEFFEEMHDKQTTKMYTVHDFSLAEQRPADFVEAALKVRPGARVDDRVQGKSYVYGGRPVSQADLDRVIKQAKTKAR